ncbi:MAG: excinuclease ABC subunit C [Clostridium sp. SCN 57-10]|nr:MAG: excinuclease ABC subunit C [Clostridium sp. SCN 57-10]
MNLAQLRIKALELPLVPGVYLMRDRDGTVIYVGKAKALKNRVSQYFTNLAAHTVKTRRMVENVNDFEVIYAKTEFDALLLENTLIKRYMPKYNILLKDGKGYPYVRLSSEPYGTFSITAERGRDKARYFGPYGGRSAARAAINIVSELFGLPTCNRQFPRDIGRERPCLRYHIKKCCGICIANEVSEEQYDIMMRQAALLLDGKVSDLAAQIEEKMLACAEALDFEHAAALRDRLNAVRRMGQSRIVTGVAMSDTDVAAFASHNSRGAIAVLQYSGGTLIDKKVELFDGLEEADAADALESFLQQHYAREERAPAELLVSHELAGKESVEEFLYSLRGAKCRISVPERGDRRKMLELALQNAEFELSAAEIREQKSRKTAEMLGELCGTKAPSRIECYDISNTAGQDAVASMVVFVEGKPLKRDYKRFRIKEAVGGDDVGALTEVLTRRLERAKNGDESFLPLPDLFLMDGGVNQTAAARRVLDSFGIELPVFGCVKDDKHRTRALVAPHGGEIGLQTTPAVFALLGRIQEETHRFAVDYHQEVRSKNVRRSALDGIPQVGEERKKKLLKHFGTIAAIKAATVEQLCEAVPQNAAEAIYAKFHADGGTI